MFKKITTLLALLLVIFLVGCGGGEATGPDGQEVAAEPTEEPATPTPAGDAEAGEPLFVQSCSACHGPDATGIEGIGKDLTTSEFIPSMTDEEFVEFVNTGRPSSHPDNTTGIDMPPKGGNPALTDEQILDIIAYLRSIHE